MDFSYSEEQLEVRALARQILGDQTGNERQQQIDAQEIRFDEKLWQDLADAGLLGVALDSERGGMGFNFETLALLLEEVGRTVAAVPVIPALVTAALPLQRFGSEAQKHACLPGLANGKHLITAALIEPGNEDPARPYTGATAAGAGWVLSGSKHCVPYAQQAEQCLITAQAEDELLVFLLPLSSPGLTLKEQASTAGEPQYQLDLESVALGESVLIARGEQALELVQWMQQLTRAAIAAMATGLCDAMLRMTAEYTSQREQFGVPVATFQAVGHRAADCYIDIECLRLVSQEAVSLLSLGLDAEQATTIAKIWTGDVCHRVSQASQHLHGGTGVDRDYPLFRYCLMARQLELSVGSSARLLEQLGTDIAVSFTSSGLETID
ncbi:MAG: acyl-CoA/acyl-ACP dehydrogenase [Gammaproteobacteria bacterium]|nr:acyl-CoA/acyl-ACP dehydrogenase [Gammaproteobacteria bacterium]